MRTTFRVPADEVIDFLREQGATRTSTTERFPDGGNQTVLVAQYVDLMRTGKWWASERPVHLDARSGTIWQGENRVAAIAQVDWTQVWKIPMFTIEVQRRD